MHITHFTVSQDGSNENISAIDKGEPLTPVAGQVYTNRGGGQYLCLAPGPDCGTVYYNQLGGSSRVSAIFQNTKSGWTFTSKGLMQYLDRTIEWDHSSDGHFAEIEGG